MPEIWHVRLDERGWETGRCRMAQATAPILDSTRPCENCFLCYDLPCKLEGRPWRGSWKGWIAGSTLFPALLDDYVAEDNPVRCRRIRGRT